MARTRRATVVLCPDCDEEITFRSPPREEQKFICPHCEAYLVVISVDPLEIEWDESGFFDDDDWDEEVW